jgi:hypothetical protein
MQPYYMGPPLINLPVGYPTYQANLDDSVGNLLDPVLGPPLQFVGETTILFAKAALYTWLALTTWTVLSPLVGNLIESVR